jgi:hypothetical protein
LFFYIFFYFSVKSQRWLYVIRQKVIRVNGKAQRTKRAGRLHTFCIQSLGHCCQINFRTEREARKKKMIITSGASQPSVRIVKIPEHDADTKMPSAIIYVVPSYAFVIDGFLILSVHFSTIFFSLLLLHLWVQ